MVGKNGVGCLQSGLRRINDNKINGTHEYVLQFAEASALQRLVQICNSNEKKSSCREDSNCKSLLSVSLTELFLNLNNNNIPTIIISL